MKANRKGKLVRKKVTSPEQQRGEMVEYEVNRNSGEKRKIEDNMVIDDESCSNDGREKKIKLNVVGSHDGIVNVAEVGVIPPREQQ